MDFNIRAGNTLVGFSSISQVRNAAENEQERDESGRRQSRFLLGNADERISRIEQTAADLQQAFDAFRARQIEGEPLRVVVSPGGHAGTVVGLAPQAPGPAAHVLPFRYGLR